jgi:hypothetical protein
MELDKKVAEILEGLNWVAETRSKNNAEIRRKRQRAEYCPSVRGRFLHYSENPQNNEDMRRIDLMEADRFRDNAMIEEESIARLTEYDAKLAHLQSRYEYLLDKWTL